MQVGYSARWKKPFVVSKMTSVVIFLLALPLTMRMDKATPAPRPMVVKASAPAKVDPRTDRLMNFFSRLHCPIINLAQDFVNAADENHLDWRLLPSISVIESSGGKAYKNNNIFGWNQGDQFFPTISSGIHEVAFKLGQSPLYRHHDVLGKLRLYNPNEGYAEAVLSVMRRISPVIDLRTPDRSNYVSD